MIKKEVVIENCTISKEQGLHQQKATLKKFLWYLITTKYTLLAQV